MASATDPNANGAALYAAIIAAAAAIPIAAYVTPVQTNPQIAQASYNTAVAAGAVISCNSIPTLNGVYALDQMSLGRITSEQVYIATANTFTNGQTSRSWLDLAGNPHVFPNTAKFTAFGEVMAQYDDALLAALATGLAGEAWVTPPAPGAIP